MLPGSDARILYGVAGHVLTTLRLIWRPVNMPGKGMAQVLGSLPPTPKTRMEPSATGSAVAQLWWIQPRGERTKWGGLLSVCHSTFQKHKQSFEQIKKASINNCSNCLRWGDSRRTKSLCEQAQTHWTSSREGAGTASYWCLGSRHVAQLPSASCGTPVHPTNHFRSTSLIHNPTMLLKVNSNNVVKNINPKKKKKWHNRITVTMLRQASLLLSKIKSS